MMAAEITTIESFDGYSLKGKLTLPDGKKPVAKLVLFVNGSGPNTYDNHRIVEEKEFRYFDFFADEFSKRGIAFFSYSTRGVELNDKPPFYTINREAYATYLPSNSVEDIHYMLEVLKTHDRLNGCKVFLIGCSEGSTIAPLFAKKYPATADALFLIGYAHDNMKEVIRWQLSGAASMVWYRCHFEADGEGRISKAAYEADPNRVIENVLQGATFESIDGNRDGYIDESDMFTLLKNMREDIWGAIERQDDEWLMNQASPVTSAWYREHFGLKRNGETLPALELPIFIFHGACDQNCDVNGVYAIRDRFAALGKTNLHIQVFENHNHDMNYMDIILKREIPAGIQALLDAIAEME
ncbi:MAG: lysophospholipase [Oscillospiraceae bacterium]|nr:lysophospholipase [Oscillospiraceae bacterium]